MNLCLLKESFPWSSKAKLVGTECLGQDVIDLILGDLLQSVFFVVSAPDNIVQSKLVSLTNMAGF